MTITRDVCVDTLTEYFLRKARLVVDGVSEMQLTSMFFVNNCTELKPYSLVIKKSASGRIFFRKSFDSVSDLVQAYDALFEEDDNRSVFRHVSKLTSTIFSSEEFMKRKEAEAQMNAYLKRVDIPTCSVCFEETLLSTLCGHNLCCLCMARVEDCPLCRRIITDYLPSRDNYIEDDEEEDASYFVPVPVPVPVVDVNVHGSEDAIEVAFDAYNAVVVPEPAPPDSVTSEVYSGNNIIWEDTSSEEENVAVSILRGAEDLSTDTDDEDYMPSAEGAEDDDDDELFDESVVAENENDDESRSSDHNTNIV